MRKILFRGKTVDSGEWVIGSLHVRSNGDYFILNDDEGDKVEPSSIGEYTCVTDKNGTRIFEGDILDCRFPTADCVAVVEWVPALYALAMVCKLENGNLFYTSLDGSPSKKRSVEVIGNIHDNFELWEVE